MAIAMKTCDWLENFAPGFHALSENERQAINEFTLLWSLFEAKVLISSGNAKAIAASVKQWHVNGQLNTETFAHEFAYFRNSYVENGEFTQHFAHLHLRPNDMSDFVSKVLNGDNATPEEVAIAVLIIVYRFRNNLFHGVKWFYELQGQQENFMHANTALMRAIEVHSNAAPGGSA